MTLQAELANALRLHRAGQLAQAARLYEEILSREPEQVDALHHLAALRQQQGQFAQAVELWSKAVALRPGVALYHASLAEAHRALRQFEQAVVHGRTALELRREYPAAHNNLGLALQALGQTAEAADQFKAALALRPNFFEALMNLGQLLLELGRASEALPHCRQAVAIAPGFPPAHNTLGDTFRASGRFPEAIACYTQAIRLNPDFAGAHANLGTALRQDGRLQESVPWFRRATELQPLVPAFWAYLADATTDLDRYSEAIQCYRRLIELEPSQPRLYTNLGWLLRREGKYDEAKEIYDRALRIQPEFSDAMIGMGDLLEELGQMTEAERWFRQVIASHPADPIAPARLARHLRNQISDDDFRVLKARIADPTLSETARVPMLSALANVLDARGQYSEAAQYMRRANAAALAESRQKSQPYRCTEHELLVSDMIAAFRPEFFARFAGAGLTTRRPVFVFGLPRSGTSLVEQILASHSQVHGAGEIDQGRLDFKAIPTLLNRPDAPLICLADQSAEVIREIARRHEARLMELSCGAARVVDKMTDNYLYLGLLAILFPNATFIHTRRDLRDVALSCWMTQFRSLSWTNDQRDMAHRFQQYLRLMDHWRTVLPAPIHEVDYEATVDNIEAVARRLIAACGLDWEPACLDFHKTKRPVATASLAQVRQPIYKNSIVRWKNYEHELGDLFSVLAELTSGNRGGSGTSTTDPVKPVSPPTK